MRKTIIWLGWLGIMLLCSIGVLVAAMQIPPNPQAYSPEFAKHPLITLLHVVPGLLFMLLGPFQFIPQVRARYLGLHRFLGYTFIFSSIMIGITAVLIANTFPTGGIGEQISVTFFGLLFLYFLWRAFICIKRRDIIRHREFMIRVFMLGLAVSVFRIVMLLMVFVLEMDGIRYIDLNFALSFGGMCLMAEAWIMYTRKSLLASNY